MPQYFLSKIKNADQFQRVFPLPIDVDNNFAAAKKNLKLINERISVWLKTTERLRQELENDKTAFTSTII